MTREDIERAKAWVVFVAILAVAVFFSETYESFQRDKLANRFDGSNSVALAWVDAFTKHDFVACDEMVLNQDVRLYSPMVITRSRDDRFYEAVLTAVVDCISDITLVAVEDNTYKLEIRLVKREPVDDFDLASLADVRTKFLDGALDDSDFIASLRDIYLETMSKSCFAPSSEVVTAVAILYESEIDGVVSVFGTSEFVDIVLQESGIAYNLSAYESSVKSEVDNFLKQGG